MNKGINKFLKDMVKCDLISGVIISLLIWLISSFTYAEIYLIGISISLINFIVSGYVTINSLEYNKRNKYIPIISFIRIILIIAISMFFINDITIMSYYMFGFISHYILLIANCIKNRKGSV
ncbi:hypothetical protein [Clostridium uliginosum]|uniref:ATP synthase I chain n=1 Tax=Clostridium uliginosum TaxID=119641 RepID=A0A1I1IAQ0_9CLOT|nr:hypothetical protein [Clostridium uliginosum]SFC33071.1 hypothetical protein SAMN05421842_102203 [Clostridium uliginosum]